MITDILKDKFYDLKIAPILAIAFFIKEPSEWIFILIMLCLSLGIFGIFIMFKKEYYVHNINLEDDFVELKIQKNFSAKNISTFRLDLSCVDNFEFNNAKPFHAVSIRYTNSENLFERKIFKIKDDDSFISLLYALKNKTAMHNT